MKIPFIKCGNVYLKCLKAPERAKTLICRTPRLEVAASPPRAAGSSSGRSPAASGHSIGRPLSETTANPPPTLHLCRKPSRKDDRRRFALISWWSSAAISRCLATTSRVSRKNTSLSLLRHSHSKCNFKLRAFRRHLITTDKEQLVWKERRQQQQQRQEIPADHSSLLPA